MGKGHNVKECVKCRVVKPLTDFHYKTKRHISRRHSCKSCDAIPKQNPTYKQSQRDYAKNRRKSPAQRAIENEQSRTYGLSVRGRATRMWCAARHRARTFEIPFTITKDFVEVMILSGYCQRTGIPFDLNRPANKRNYNPYSPSIDRIDCHKGYTFDNVQIVCTAYNLGKNQMTDDQFLEFCKLVVNKNA